MSEEESPYNKLFEVMQSLPELDQELIRSVIMIGENIASYRTKDDLIVQLAAELSIMTRKYRDTLKSCRQVHDRVVHTDREMWALRRDARDSNGAYHKIADMNIAANERIKELEKENKRLLDLLDASDVRDL